MDFGLYKMPKIEGIFLERLKIEIDSGIIYNVTNSIIYRL